MTDTDVENKIKYILVQISKQKGDEDYIIELLNHSQFKFEKHWNSQTFPNAYNLEIFITPDVFTKNYSTISDIARITKSRINNSTKLIIEAVHARLEQWGARVQAPPHAFEVRGADGTLLHMTTLSFWDPDGYFFEINQRHSA